jgi:putative transposase
MSVERSALHYESRVVAKAGPVLERMREQSSQYPQLSYRRIQGFLERQRFLMSADRAHRLWRCARLQAARKRPRRRVASSCPRALVPTGGGQMWAYTFVFDAYANGPHRKYRTRLRKGAYGKSRAA